MICVDASVAAKRVFPEENSTRALALINEEATRGELIVAPFLLPIEVTNIIRQRMRRENLRQSDAKAVLDRFLAFPVRLIQSDDLHRRALALAVQHDLPAVYDAHYVALAETLGVTLWTDDQRLLRTLNGRLSFVRAIGEHMPRNSD